MEEIQINTVFQNRVFMRFFIGESRNKLHKKNEKIEYFGLEIHDSFC